MLLSLGKRFFLAARMAFGAWLAIWSLGRLLCYCLLSFGAVNAFQCRLCGRFKWKQIRHQTIHDLGQQEALCACWFQNAAAELATERQNGEGKPDSLVAVLAALVDCLVSHRDSTTNFTAAPMDSFPPRWPEFGSNEVPRFRLS